MARSTSLACDWNKTLVFNRAFDARSAEPSDSYFKNEMEVEKMKYCLKFLLLFACAGVFLTNSGCGVNQVAQGTIEEHLKTPSKTILVTSGDLSQPYEILGAIDCSLNGKSLYSSSEIAGKEIEDLLRKVAFTKYGEKVDAIINAKNVLNPNGGFWGTVAGAYGAPTGRLSANGVAVHFK